MGSKRSLRRFNQKDHLQIIHGPAVKDKLGGVLMARTNSSEFGTTQPRSCTALFEAHAYSGALGLHFTKGLLMKSLLYLVGWAPMTSQADRPSGNRPPVAVCRDANHPF